MLTKTSNSNPGVGHGHVHYKALLKIILQSVVLLPVDNDVLYMVDCIQDQYSLLVQGGKRWPPYAIIGINLFLHNRALFPNKNHLIIKLMEQFAIKGL